MGFGDRIYNSNLTQDLSFTFDNPSFSSVSDDMPKVILPGSSVVQWQDNLPEVEGSGPAASDRSQSITVAMMLGKIPMWYGKFLLFADKLDGAVSIPSNEF